jgi:hypothetical protein
MQVKSKYILIAIFIFIFALRLYFSFSSGHFASDESYFSLRYIQNVFKGDVLNFYDDLSFGGRVILYPPLFYIIFALFSFGNILVLKIVNELVLSSLVFIVYFLSRKISHNEGAGLLGTFVANVSPVFLVNTTNIVTPYSLSIPLLFLMFYLAINLDDRKSMVMFIVLSFLLPFIHSASFLFVLAVLFYFLLLADGALQAGRTEKQLLLLSMFINILMILILYKKVLLSYGLAAIWQNLPVQMMMSNYTGLDVAEVIIGAGFVSVIFGFIGLYFGFFREKNKGSYICGAFILAILTLLVLKFITIAIGLVLLVICLGIMSSFSFKKIILYIDRLNIGRLRMLLIIILVVLVPLFLVSSSFASLNGQGGLKEGVINDMDKLKDFDGVVVVSNVYEGNLITGIAGKKNVIDTQFLLAPRPIERLKNIELLYKAASIGFAAEIIKKYDIDIIYLSDQTKDLYNINTLYYADNSDCFVKDGNFYVYKCKKR